MKIYTRTGDKGKTALLGGTRVSKADLRIDTYGTVDELNSYIGLVRDQEVNQSRRTFLIQVQERLFTIGAILASDPSKDNIVKPDLEENDLQLMENEIDQMEKDLPPLKNFVLPGGHQSVSFCHLARVVCRRAERLVVALDQVDQVDQLVMQYLNRLSDYLFVLSRKMSDELGADEVPWRPRG